MLRRLGVPVLVGLGFASVVLALAIYGVAFLHLIELKALDAFFLARGPRDMSQSQVAVVTVGERSLDEIGRWPWLRTQVAGLLDAVRTAGAGAVGLDMGFFEPDQRFSAQALKEVMQAAASGRPLSSEQVVRRFHPDVVLARAVAAAADKVVLGYFFHMAGGGVKHLKPEEIKARRAALERFAFPAVRYRNAQAQKAQLLTAIAPEPTQPVIMAAARFGGYFNVLPETDGVTRRLPLVIKCGTRLYPALSLATLSRLLKLPLPVVDIYSTGLHQIRLGDRTIPVGPQGRMWINLRGGAGLVPGFEAVDVLNGRIPQGALAGKAVLIGVSATGLFDVKSTVFGPVHPGVEVQAQAMDNILRGDFLRTPVWAGLFALLAIIGLGLIGALCLGLMRPVAGSVAGISVGVAFVLLCYYLFSAGYVLQVVHPILALLAAGGGAVLWRNLTTEREKRQVRQAFSHYLNPQVINELLKKPGNISMGGRKQELSILFCDIRGFTTLSERMDPELISSQLNTHLDRMTQAVFRHDGVLDKFIGDAVMAFYGAPVMRKDHARLACRTALDMVAALPELDGIWQDMGAPRLRIGVGINTGEVVVGNLGSGLRLDYTVVGDAVNLASRLEGLSRRFEPGIDIMVGQATVDAALGDFFFRPLDVVRVKGKSRFVVVYQLMGEDKGQGAPAVLAPACKAFEAYQAQDFARARELLQEIARRFDDEPARQLVERCDHYLAEPPPVGWG